MVEIPATNANDYVATRDEIVRFFELKARGACISGVDVVFQEFSREDAVVGIEWDNWSGFIVVAKSPSADALLLEIAKFLKGRASD